MSSEFLVDIIAGASLFRGLSREDCALIAARAVGRSFPVDGVILEEGEPNTSLFVIAEGEVHIERSSGPHMILAAMEPGDVFGEMSFLGGLVATASVRAYEPCFVLELTLEAFEGLLSTRADLAARIHRNLAIELRDRLVRTNALVEQWAGLADLMSNDPDVRLLLGRT